MTLPFFDDDYILRRAAANGFSVGHMRYIEACRQMGRWRNGLDDVDEASDAELTEIGTAIERGRIERHTERFLPGKDASCHPTT